MATIRLGDYCCQAGDRVIETAAFSPEDLVLGTEGRNSLMFSPLGNQPTSPILALVGITPGSQSEVFAALLRTQPVEEAAKRAAFAKGQEAIKDLLRANGFADHLGLDLDGDLNDNPKILTTSLVKCCLKVDGIYQYKAPDIAASAHARTCVQNRFLADMAKYPSLRWVVIFGDAGWEAVTTLKLGTMTIKERMESSGLTVLNLPHFAQNFQQRALFALDPSDDAAYLQSNPSHQSYAPKAHAMRSALLKALRATEPSAATQSAQAGGIQAGGNQSVTSSAREMDGLTSRSSSEERFATVLCLLHETGDKLYPVRTRNRDTGRLAFRVSPGGAGGNTKAMGIEVDDEEMMKRYVVEHGYAVRAATRTGSRTGLFKLDQRSIVGYEEEQ